MKNLISILVLFFSFSIIAFAQPKPPKPKPAGFMLNGKKTFPGQTLGTIEAEHIGIYIPKGLKWLDPVTGKSTKSKDMEVYNTFTENNESYAFLALPESGDWLTRIVSVPGKEDLKKFYLKPGKNRGKPRKKYQNDKAETVTSIDGDPLWISEARVLFTNAPAHLPQMVFVHKDDIDKKGVVNVSGKRLLPNQNEYWPITLGGRGMARDYCFLQGKASGGNGSGSGNGSVAVGTHSIQSVKILRHNHDGRAPSADGKGSVWGYLVLPVGSTSTYRIKNEISKTFPPKPAAIKSGYTVTVMGPGQASLDKR